MKRISILWLHLLLTATNSSAQNFKLLRYDEDFSFLKDSARTFYNRIKYVSLSLDGSNYVSFGGEIRQELDRAKNEDWGAANAGTDFYSLQRYNLHADLHFGRRFRIFGQLRSGLEFGRRNGPRPIDEDQLNLQNLFIDVIPYQRRQQSLVLRFGRQEIQYGSGRLVDVREGPNLRQYFDGAKIAYASSKWHIDVFAFENGRIKTAVFDNPFSQRAKLWGVYSTWFASPEKGVDLYYLGIDRKQIKFDEGVANEIRHTLGARFFKIERSFFYNLEIGYQIGRFGSRNIRSWGGSSEIGYRYVNLLRKPTLKLRADYVAGDKKKGDAKLRTFNAIYPNGGYFGMNPQAGPANIWSLHPSLSWSLTQTFLLSHEVVFYWRQSLQDGIYRPDGAFNLSSSGSLQHYIGTAYISTANWEIWRYLNLTIGVQYFQTGKFINEIIPNHKDGFFITSLLGFKF